MEYLYEKAQESAEYIKMHTTKRPKKTRGTRP